MKYIVIGLTMLLVFGCIEVYAEEYTYKYYIENDIARVEKIKKQELKPLLHLVNCQEILEANYVKYNKKEIIFKSKDYIFDKEIDEKLRTKLKEVLKYYKKEYNFYSRLVVRNKGKQCYKCGKVIFISMQVVKDHAKKMNWKEEKIVIFILLHEIKHAIDYKYNRKQFIADKSYSRRNKMPHNERPQEKRANDFAKKEINKWI